MSTTVIRILGIKGGVGKSSIAFALARIISISGYKVLFLDRDNLHTISKLLGIKECELSFVLGFTVFACNDWSKVPLNGYDYIIIDTYAGISKEEISSIKGDRVFNVFITDYFSIQNTLEYIMTWNMQENSRNFLVINMVKKEDAEYNSLQLAVVNSLISKKNVKNDGVFLFSFNEEYYGSYRVDSSNIELLLAHILTG
ncbi:ParA family protein [Sulfolobus tengchongensis]|uniref:ParA family protein n=1 Tax=Sulfolobus tengchongensis TaxID=207809 RepID=A0AAX4L381_9CREN